MLFKHEIKQIQRLLLNGYIAIHLRFLFYLLKETSITHSDGHVTVNKTVKVTGKGQQYFVNMFLAKQEQRKGDCRPVLNMTKKKGGEDE